MVNNYTVIGAIIIMPECKLLAVAECVIAVEIAFQLKVLNCRLIKTSGDGGRIRP